MRYAVLEKCIVVYVHIALHHNTIYLHTGQLVSGEAITVN